MFDNHTFRRLDVEQSVDDAVEMVRKCTEIDNGYGCIGCRGEHGERTFQWRPGDDWETQVRDLFELAHAAQLVGDET